MCLSTNSFLFLRSIIFVPHPPAAIEGLSDPPHHISEVTSCLASVGHYTVTIIPGQYGNWRPRYMFL